MNEQVRIVDDAGGSDTWEYDLSGRIRNLGFPPSPLNALFPLFEAVSNGLHAIEARFDREAAKRGKILIEVLRVDSEDTDPPVAGFRVEDNGIGLGWDNWRSFRTADTSSKLKRGGKGVGRLSWLKVYKKVSVTSQFEEGSRRYLRNFDFGLSPDKGPISGHELFETPQAQHVGTRITLKPFDDPYMAACPRTLEVIASKLVGHFLKNFASYEVPSIELIDRGQTLKLLDFFAENVVDELPAKLTVNIAEAAEPIDLEVYHILLRKGLRFHETQKHFMFYVGDGRVVKEERIDNQLGLGLVGPDADAIYVGIVASPFLNLHVNQERTSFTLLPDSLKTIHSAALLSTKEYLAQYISLVRQKQAATALRVISENPQFLSVTSDVTEFVESSLTLNVHSEEEIYVELSRQKLRQRRRVSGEIKSLSANGIEDAEDLEERIQRVAKALNADKKGSLAEYVVKRKEILNLLSNSITYSDPENRKYLREEIVHDLIIPIRSDGDDLSYDDHNLWILDDRLAFYSYFKSDKPFKTFLADTDERKEPDVGVVFDRSLAFNREGQDEPIIIIEFKRPGRTEYDYNSSPVVQVLNYVDIFRKGGSLTDKTGKRIKPIPISTRFICFIVADFCSNLENVLRVSPANNKSADGEGYFGFSPDHNAFIEVLPYHKLLHDARIRNEAFFEKLGLKL